MPREGGGIDCVCVVGVFFFERKKKIPHRSVIVVIPTLLPYLLPRYNLSIFYSQSHSRPDRSGQDTTRRSKKKKKASLFIYHHHHHPMILIKERKSKEGSGRGLPHSAHMYIHTR